MKASSPFTFIFALAVLLLGHQAQATTINVPEDWDTITSAIAAAVDGDVVVINDSAEYAEDIAINKNISIVAAPGQTPTLVGQTNNGQNIQVYGAGTNVRIGAVGSGRLTLDRNNTCDAGVLKNTTGSLTLENILITGAKNDSSARGLYVLYEGQVDMTEVTVDQGGVGGAGITIQVLTADPPASTFNITRCDFINPGTGKATEEGIIMQSGRGTINIEDSIIHAGQRGLYYFPSGPGPWTVNVNKSCITTDGDTFGKNLIRFQGIESHLNASYSVFAGFAPPAFAGALLYVDQTGTSNSSAHFDHCDLYYPEGYGIRVFSTAGGATNRSFSVTNSIVTTEYAALTGTTEPSDSFISDYNDIISTGPAHTQWSDGGHNVLNVNPLYANPHNCDFRHSEPSLDIASSTGGSIGSNLNIALLVPVELSAFDLN